MSGLYWVEERAAWPVSHLLVPATLYFVLRRPLSSWLLDYIWETIEAAIFFLLARNALIVGSPDTASAAESVTDSIVGDPIMGFIGIGTMATFDVAAGTGHAHCAYDWRARLIAFAVSAASSFAIDWRTEGGARVGVLLYGVVTLLAFNALLLSPRWAPWAQRKNVPITRFHWTAWTSTMFLNAFVSTVCLVVFVLPRSASVWITVSVLGVLFWFIAVLWSPRRVLTEWRVPPVCQAHCHVPGEPHYEPHL